MKLFFSIFLILSGCKSTHNGSRVNSDLAAKDGFVKLATKCKSIYHDSIDLEYSPKRRRLILGEGNDKHGQFSTIFEQRVAHKSHSSEKGPLLKIKSYKHPSLKVTHIAIWYPFDGDSANNISLYNPEEGYSKLIVFDCAFNRDLIEKYLK